MRGHPDWWSRKYWNQFGIPALISTPATLLLENFAEGHFQISRLLVYSPR